MKESEPNYLHLQEIEVESGLFLGPQVTCSVMKEGVALITSGGIHVQQEIWRHVQEIPASKKIELQHPPL